MIHRLYIDVKSELDALFLQQFLRESLWRQQAMREGKEDLTVHLIDIEETKE